ncbi:hypothetical protein AFLA_011850 [Aspergillus flavus NRRL3357]|nr:hypothetical protein AFLA_011850 [Aspergillus flavus NRRL3357]
MYIARLFSLATFLLSLGLSEAHLPPHMTFGKPCYISKVCDNECGGIGYAVKMEYGSATLTCVVPNN